MVDPIEPPPPVITPSPAAIPPTPRQLEQQAQARARGGLTSGGIARFEAATPEQQAGEIAFRRQQVGLPPGGIQPQAQPQQQQQRQLSTAERFSRDIGEAFRQQPARRDLSQDFARDIKESLRPRRTQQRIVTTRDRRVVPIKRAEQPDFESDIRQPSIASQVLALQGQQVTQPEIADLPRFQRASIGRIDVARPGQRVSPLTGELIEEQALRSEVGPVRFRIIAGSRRAVSSLEERLRGVPEPISAPIIGISSFVLGSQEAILRPVATTQALGTIIGDPSQFVTATQQRVAKVGELATAVELAPLLLIPSPRSVVGGVVRGVRATGRGARTVATSLRSAGQSIARANVEMLGSKKAFIPSSRFRKPKQRRLLLQTVSPTESRIIDLGPEEAGFSKGNPFRDRKLGSRTTLETVTQQRVINIDPFLREVIRTQKPLKTRLTRLKSRPGRGRLRETKKAFRKERRIIMRSLRKKKKAIRQEMLQLETPPERRQVPRMIQQSLRTMERLPTPQQTTVIGGQPITIAAAQSLIPQMQSVQAIALNPPQALSLSQSLRQVPVSSLRSEAEAVRVLRDVTSQRQVPDAVTERVSIQRTQPGETIQRSIELLDQPATKQATRQESMPAETRTITKTIPGTDKPPPGRKPLGKPPKRITPRRKKDKEVAGKILKDKIKKLLKEPHDVYVKRTLKKVGKTRLSRGFEKANKKPLSKLAALGLGASIADEFANRSYEIKKSKGKVRSRPALRRAWEKKKGKFSRSKKNPNIIVEKSKFAIDSRKEKEGIPFEAARLRRAKKRK